MTRIRLQRASPKGSIFIVCTLPSLPKVHIPTLSLLRPLRLGLGDVVAAASRGLLDCIRSLGDVVSTPTISVCIGGSDRT